MTQFKSLNDYQHMQQWSESPPNAVSVEYDEIVSDPSDIPSYVVNMLLRK